MGNMDDELIKEGATSGQPTGVVVTTSDSSCSSSSSRYGSVGGPCQDDRVPLRVGHLSDAPPRPRSWLLLACWSVLALAAALALTATARTTVLWGNPPSTRQSPASTTSVIGADQTAAFLAISELSHPYLARAGGGEEPAVPPLQLTYPSDPLPFSTLGPEDVGMDTHSSRPADSSPGAVFGSWRRREASVGKQRIGNSDSDGNNNRALPTNMWYENLLLGSVNDGILTDHNRAYCIPYIVDFVGPVPGVRTQFPHVLGSDTIVQMATVPQHGLTLGTADDGVDAVYVVDKESPPSQLGLGLVWSKWSREDDEGESSHASPVGTMKSSVLRGLPYVTMQYSRGMRPAIAAEIPLLGSPVIDGDASTNRTMKCGALRDGNIIDDNGGDPPADIVRVQGEVSLTFAESDFTWLVFFSRPVHVACYEEAADPNAVPPPPGVVDFTVRNVFQLRVVEPEEDSQSRPLVIRAALANNCTTGHNPLYCVDGRPRAQSRFGDLLRSHADVYPSAPKLRYEFPSSPLRGDVAAYSLIHFDWGARSMRRDTLDVSAATEENDISWWKAQAPPPQNLSPKRSKELLMYALPHHIDSLEEIVGSTHSATGYCTAGLHGRACLMRGGEWIMREDLDGPPSFAAPRPPHHEAVPAMAEAVSRDIHFELPEYYMRGAGDTYFSGKMLAKLARIIAITHELKGLAATPETDSFDLDDPSQRELKQIVEACRSADLPSDTVFIDALARLRRGVEIWLNGEAEAKFLYDQKWGGLVNCGCLFNSESQSCDNVYPNCPTFSDPGLNFGNGFYNDHHFHYGYHIYAAAVVANFDFSWGREYYQRVLMLIRDIANPSIHDNFFPAFRQKDWFLGSSWASGIATLGGQPYLNGRNQESSSEAIHAYEAISLYGAVMVHAWGDGISASAEENDNAKTSGRIRDMGRLLTATELRSAQRYWHVLHGDSATNTVYPLSYKPGVVGMMWDTMAQFQTWFGNSPYLAYGIQLMPLTSVAERRDAVKWAQQMYLPFADSCESDRNCREQGWSVLQYAMLSTVGHRDLALKKAKLLPASVFESAGGNGHSMTNTLWYIATRPNVAEPLVLSPRASAHEMPTNELKKPQSITCGCPNTCTLSQQETSAGGGDFTCGTRILWLMESLGKTEAAACRQVGGEEFAIICGGCDPDRCTEPPTEVSPEQTTIQKACPPCSPAVCKGETNRCPRSLMAPFLCLAGVSRGGCAQTPWRKDEEDNTLCNNCCKLTESCFGA